MMLLLSLLANVGLLSCDKKTHITPESIRASTDTSIASLAKKSFVNSTTFEQAQSELGAYDSITFFVLRQENITEFRIELLNFYNENDLKDSLSIVEVTWSNGMFENITRWYQQDSSQWKNVHQARWAKGVEF